jgi:hypothetical protein
MIPGKPMPRRPLTIRARAPRSHSPLFAGQNLSPEGERSAETARGACEAPLACRAIGTPGRLRGVPRPFAIRDARLSALCCGDFGPPGPRFRLRHYPPERVQRCSSRPGPSVRRAVPCLPGLQVRAAAAEHHSRLRLQNVSGRRPSMSRDDSYHIRSISYVKNYILHLYAWAAMTSVGAEPERIMTEQLPVDVRPSLSSRFSLCRPGKIPASRHLRSVSAHTERAANPCRACGRASVNRNDVIPKGPARPASQLRQRPSARCRRTGFGSRTRRRWEAPQRPAAHSDRHLHDIEAAGQHECAGQGVCDTVRGLTVFRRPI